MADENNVYDGEELKQVKETVMKGLEFSRYKLLSKYPFVGEMLLRFSLVPTYDASIDTACTDGTKIYFDCEFYSTLTPGQRQFILAHEVWHNIFLHFTRKQTRDMELWNIATDMEINHMLNNDGMELVEGVCMPEPIVAGKSAEDIYAYLQQKQNNGGGGNGKGNGGGAGNSQSQGNGGQGKGSGNGNNQTPYGNQIDKHIAPGKKKDTNQQPKNGKWGKKGNDPSCNPSLNNPQETAAKIQEAIVSVAQSIERKQGSLPGAVAGYVKKALEPEVNWKEALSQFVTKCLGDEHSWHRISRHALARGMYLQGRDGEKIKVAVAVDTSGSYLSDLPKFLGELNGLVSSFGNYEITLIECDSDVQHTATYDDENPFDVENYQMHGGGGTDFRPAFKWVKENMPEQPDCFLYFTDGYGESPEDAPGYPVLWVLTSDGCNDFCEWGEKMRFKEDNRTDW